MCAGAEPSESRTRACFCQHRFVWIRFVCLYSTAFVDGSHGKHAGIRPHSSSSLSRFHATMLSDSSCFQCVLLFKHSPSNTGVSEKMQHAARGVFSRCDAVACWLRVFESFIYTRQHSLHFIGSDRRGCDGRPSRLLLLLFTSP